MWARRRVHHPDVPALSDLIGDREAFLRDRLFRAPLVADSQARRSLPSSEDIWASALLTGSRTPGFRLVRAGDTTGRGGVTRAVGVGNRTLDDMIDANAVIDRYRRGDTVVLQGLQHTDPRLARFVTNLALDLDHPVQVNAYLSPPAEQGLDIHFDYHDVFVIQLSGSKRWRVWDRLARSVEPIRTQYPIAKPDASELGEPLMEFVLEPGRVLYLPRGYPHAATTTDEPSDHLTVGVIAIGWYRFFKHVLELAVSRGEFTGSLPPHSLEPEAGGDLDARPSGDPIGGLDAAMPAPDILAKMMGPSEYREWLARAIWKRMPQTRLRPMVAATAVDGPLAFTPGPLIWLTERDGRAVLGIGDKVLTLPGAATGFLAELLGAAEPVDPDRFDQLDASSREVILRRLINEGVLTAAADRDASPSYG